MRVSLKNLASARCICRATFSTNRRNLIIYLILLVVFVVEVLVYHSATFWWYPIDCSDCTRILLVADPQLIGLHNENNNLLTPFSIWDSDRYLARSFAHAFRFSKPDVVVFLGDLFDEGSTASDEEFKSYLRRLFNIFLQKPFASVQHIWLPGDNDIGGEFNDRITKHKVRRFEHAFSQPDIIGVKNVKFYKINRLMSTMPKFLERKDFSSLDSITVGLSHLPMMMSPAIFVDKVLEKLQPHVLFTAHTHNSMIVSMQHEFRRDRLIIPVRPDANQVFEYFLGISDVYEVLVPTCSYRMGTDKIGYGFAVIDNGSLRYTVLWSPSRFPQLKFYVLALVLLFVYFMVSYCYRCCCRRRGTLNHQTTSHIA